MFGPPERDDQAQWIGYYHRSTFFPYFDRLVHLPFLPSGQCSPPLRLNRSPSSRAAELFDPHTTTKITNSPAYTSMVFAWSFTEVIRYSHYVTSLLSVKLPALEWLRFVVFSLFLSLAHFLADHARERNEQVHHFLPPLPARSRIRSLAHLPYRSVRRPLSPLSLSRASLELIIPERMH